MSEIVSTLLLVAIVVTLGVFAYTFASNGLGSLTGGLSNLINGQNKAESEHFVIEQVAFCFTSQTGCSGDTGANVYVRNVGSITSTIVSVYIVDQSTGAYVAQVPTSSGNLCTIGGVAGTCTIPVGDVADIPVTTLDTFSPAHGNSYLVTVTSNLGNTVTFVAEAT